MTHAAPAPRPKTSLSLREFHALFPDEAAARAWFEAARWPDGPVCPRCGATHQASWLASRERWTCRDCKLQYSVMSFTPMHRSHIPLLVWAQAMYLVLASPKRTSVVKISEALGLSYRTAWFLVHRIRAMVDAAEQGTGEGLGPSLPARAPTDSQAHHNRVVERMRRAVEGCAGTRLTFRDVVGMPT